MVAFDLNLKYNLKSLCKFELVLLGIVLTNSPTIIIGVKFSSVSIVGCMLVDKHPRFGFSFLPYGATHCFNESDNMSSSWGNGSWNPWREKSGQVHKWFRHHFSSHKCCKMPYSLLGHWLSESFDWQHVWFLKIRMGAGGGGGDFQKCRWWKEQMSKIWIWVVLIFWYF